MAYSHFLWRMSVALFTYSSSLIHILILMTYVCWCVSLPLPHSFTYSLLMAYVVVSVSLPHSLTYSLRIAYVAVSVLCLQLTYSHTLLMAYVAHSFLLLMAYVAVSVLCLFLTHSHTHFLWRMWLLVFCVSTSFIHMYVLVSSSLISYGVHTLTSYVYVGVIVCVSSHSHNHFLWRLLVF